MKATPFGAKTGSLLAETAKPTANANEGRVEGVIQPNGQQRGRKGSVKDVDDAEAQ